VTGGTLLTGGFEALRNGRMRWKRNEDGLRSLWRSCLKVTVDPLLPWSVSIPRLSIESMNQRHLGRPWLS